MAVDPHHLPKTPVPPSNDGRRCPGCGYQLRGLPAGRPCPECGLPVAAPVDADAPISTAPTWVRRSFRRGAYLSAACVGAAVAVLFVRTVLGAIDVRVTAGLLLVIAVLWSGAVWLLTPVFDEIQCVRRGFSRTGQLRRVVRWLAFAWIAVAGLALGRVAATGAIVRGPADDALLIAMRGAWVVAFVGVLCLAVLLQRLAAWAKDDTAERALDVVLWGLPIVTAMRFAATGSFRLLDAAGSAGYVSGGTLAGMIAMLWLGVLAALPYALLSLSGSLAWSERHAQELHDRERRRRSRSDEIDRELRRRIERMK